MTTDPVPIEAPGSTPQHEGPYNAPFAVNISFPESVVIKMVDATALNDYEISLFFSSVFSSAFFGFLVGFFQASESDAKLYGAIAIVFAIVTLFFLGWALMKRTRMTARSKEFKLTTSGVEEIKP